MVDKWWETSLSGGNLVNLTPSQANRKMIPFLQMANGKTNKIGCAYEVSKDDSGDDYVLFVCSYGTEKIRVGNPIYTRGPPCGSCRNKCTFGNRLCAT
ncbi:hypothetical protein DICVIV_13890 [Dictyocaulus viviparus]|uniref:SCP domain-containing protein n=1 Tax=Dictyocaulus viviparus TaxID=29172 RepID=A0A0D8X8W1_DICVI|nr:hypothetical protein DICVIV_13890 [Dictyocaulus viviparus]